MKTSIGDLIWYGVFLVSVTIITVVIAGWLAGNAAFAIVYT